MNTFKNALLVSGLAAVLITAPASGSAFGADGSAIIELDTTGFLDAGGGTGDGGGGGPTCTTTAVITSVDNAPSTQVGSLSNNGFGLSLFKFDSGSFPISWNPDICGVLGGSLSLTGFKTEAEVSAGTYASLGDGFQVNGLPARNFSGVYNLDAVDEANPNGTFHQVASNPTIATTTSNSNDSTTNINLTETLGVNNSSVLPNYRYVTTATFTVLTDQ